MSKANIISKAPIPIGEGGIVLYVTFSVNHGKGTLTYMYVGPAAAAILGGDDPAKYIGQPVS